ncbi:MAG: hypothetical protein CM15mP25_2950 [Gammaproteobacteria bacterium]|nr:MAG: hypothetical protein CM15mP25_2950 [Gammaproteobacteria bacterium]
MLININASPFHRGKSSERLERVKSCAAAHQLPIIYVNQVGGQDELIFDGRSFAIDAQGELSVSAQTFIEAFPIVTVDRSSDARLAPGDTVAERKISTRYGRPWCWVCAIMSIKMVFPGWY